MANEYSPAWFETFLASFPTERTKLQLAFVKRQLPLPKYAAVLDLCSGWGRIAGPLSIAGYKVTAVDRDRECVAQGAARFPAIAFRELDMRQVASLAERFDGVICLWQSFGFFDTATNQRVLTDLAGLLHPGGRIILDLYHREHFVRRQGVEASSLSGARLDTERRLKGNRLSVRVDYGGGRLDDFDWEVYTPREALEMAVSCGLTQELACANFDEGTPPAPDKASFQLVLSSSAR